MKHCVVFFAEEIKKLFFGAVLNVQTMFSCYKIIAEMNTLFACRLSPASLPVAPLSTDPLSDKVL